MLLRGVGSYLESWFVTEGGGGGESLEYDTQESAWYRWRLNDDSANYSKG